MTDLISNLADALVALNNASPRLPRKEQIEEVLRAGLGDKMFIVDQQSGGGFLWTAGNDIDITFSIGTTTWGNSTQVTDTAACNLITQEQLVKAADAICAADHPAGGVSCVMRGYHVWGSHDSGRDGPDWLEYRCDHCGVLKP